MKALAEEDPSLKGMYWVQDAGGCSGVYILEEGRTLIDAGNMYGLIDEIRELGPLDRIQRILITHSHFDHVGGVEELYQIVAPEIYVHPLSREYLRLLREPFPSFFDAMEKDYKIKYLHDGDLVPDMPTLRAIHTPGHTAGDLCFFDESTGALFSGDAVLPQKERLSGILSKPDEVCGGRMEDKVNGLRKLLRLPVRHLFPGHGKPVFNKGLDQIKLSLNALYRSLYEMEPQKAWISMGNALLDAGMLEDALQCVAKASEIEQDCQEAKELYERIMAAGKGREAAEPVELDEI
jgi:glyoxylase-like metal-dependent hydrolase (beta-lactamase superfamily II)